MPCEPRAKTPRAFVPPNRIRPSPSDAHAHRAGRSPAWSLGFLLRDPLIRPGVEQIEGERSSVEHFVVELANVELGPQFLLGAFAKLAELELAELVAESLRGPRDVTVRLRLDRWLIDRP